MRWNVLSEKMPCQGAGRTCSWAFSRDAPHIRRRAPHGARHPKRSLARETRRDERRTSRHESRAMVSERVARASPGSGPAETLGIAIADDERHRAARMNAAVATVRTPRRFSRDRDATRPSSDTPRFRLFLPHSSSVAKSPGGAAFYRAWRARTNRDARKTQKPEHFSRTSDFHFFETAPRVISRWTRR